MLTGASLEVSSEAQGKGDERALFELSALNHPEIKLKLSLHISLACKTLL